MRNFILRNSKEYNAGHITIDVLTNVDCILLKKLNVLMTQMCVNSCLVESWQMRIIIIIIILTIYMYVRKRERDEVICVAEFTYAREDK